MFDELIDPLDAASDLSVVIEKFSAYFTNWISAIDVSGAKPIKNFKKLIQPKDIFLNFNYTETLEKVYGIGDVYHIHGKCGEPLIFGHGDDDDGYDYNMVYHIGAESVLSDIFYTLKKDTKKVMNDHDDFFKSIMGGVDSIYSYGFSFGVVDQDYIRKICEVLNTEDITWYLNDYDLEEIPRFKQQLRDAGFKGKIDTFSI